MSDYSITTDFSVKDALTTGDPEKIILGADFDVEFNAISTAIASKYDSNDIASQAQAEAGASNAVLMTPGRLTQWSDAGAGMLGDIWDLTDPGADTVLGWDDSAGAVIGFTMGTGLAFNTTTIEISHLGFEDLVDPNADRILFWDDSAGAFAWLTVGTNLSITTTTLSAPAASIEATVSHDNLQGVTANEHIDHSTVSISAGTGLSGGGTIAANRTLSLSHLGLESLVDPNDDQIFFWDDSAGAAAFLDLGTSLAITGTTIDVVYSDIEANLSTGTAGMGLYAGFVDSAGTAEVLPTGWSATRDSEGVYTVTHNLALSAPTKFAVTGSTDSPSGRQRVCVTSVGANSFTVTIGSDADANVDDNWYFIAVDFSSIG